MIYERKSEPIVLFGMDLLLTERDAIDIIKLQEFSKKYNNNFNIGITMFESATVLADALKINFKLTKWYEIKRKYKLWKCINPKYILKKLSNTEIRKLTEKVFELEGVDIESLKKKIFEHSQTQS